MDAIEIIHGNNAIDVEFSASGINITGNQEDNLCIKAYHLLKKDFPQLPSIRMHLHKILPMGAGLGGGSSDGAFTLQLLNKKFHLQLSEERLLDYALQLGSDCPFFIRNKPCYATGRGEMLEAISVDLTNYVIVLVHPGIHVQTAAAFKNVKPDASRISLKQTIELPVEKWRDNLINDFELSVFGAFPEIAQIKAALYRVGALYASLSGSGSTVYGIFEKHATPEFSFPSHYFIKTLLTKH
jgi:4-diphosphocytidyl-2-C-methyl-D-erythritol kinase